MSLIRWQAKHQDPFKDLMDLNDRVFGLTLFPNLPKESTWGRDNWAPAIDVHEDQEEIAVRADLPGLKQEDIHLSLENNVLTISGERKTESEKKDRNYHLVERSYGRFERSLQLSAAVDQSKIRASYKNGVLEVVLPKAEQAKPKQIKIDVK